MKWLLVITLILILGILSYSATQHHLDAKAARMQHGNDEDRRSAKELREISRKIDQGKYLYR